MIRDILKKIGNGLLGGLCVLGFFGSMMPVQPVSVHAQINTDWPYEVITLDGEDTTDIGQILQDDSDDPLGASEQIQESYNVNFDDEQRGTAYIASIINWFLAITGLVALVVLIVGFYRMFLAKDNEEALKEARKTVVSAVIALLVIGTAWFIVSQFFDIFFRVKEGTTPV